jgi:hypothetical protein
VEGEKPLNSRPFATDGFAGRIRGDRESIGRDRAQ